MNYYEQIQKAINYIELNIENKIELQRVANEAYMSLAGLYRIFYSLTGYTIKEYIRLRRISEACTLLEIKQLSILEIGIKFGFQSNEAFSRAFRKILGVNPSSYINRFDFSKIDLIAIYFEEQSDYIIKKYPDIKVLKTLESMKVATYMSYDKEPEHKAISRLVQMAKYNNFEEYRMFGYDVSDSTKDEYGYEACITIPENFKSLEDDINIKEIPEGKYAVTCVNVKDIRYAWKMFSNWLKISPYKHGEHQCLEEHIEGINDEMEYKVQLFMPIVESLR